MNSEHHFWCLTHQLLPTLNAYFSKASLFKHYASVTMILQPRWFIINFIADRKFHYK